LPAPLLQLAGRPDQQQAVDRSAHRQRLWDHDKPRKRPAPASRRYAAAGIVFTSCETTSSCWRSAHSKPSSAEAIGCCRWPCCGWTALRRSRPSACRSIGKANAACRWPCNAAVGPTRRPRRNRQVLRRSGLPMFGGRHDPGVRGPGRIGAARHGAAALRRGTRPGRVDRVRSRASASVGAWSPRARPARPARR